MPRASVVRFLCFLGLLLFAAAAAAQISGLPQGLTCGLSYEEQKCLFPLGCGATAPINNPCNSTSTVQLDASGATHPAETGYDNVFDGDFGNGSGFGYRHQELTAAGGGITDRAMSTQFKLPKGAACGFHHTANSPNSTCMGLDPAQAFTTTPPTPELGCPTGWTPRRAADTSVYGIPIGYYWVWCEYDDPNHYSARGLSTSPATTGIACGISHNASGEDVGPVCMGYRPRENGCPSGGWTTALQGWIDQGRPGGVGLGFCTTLTSFPPPPAPARGFLDTTLTTSGTFNGWAYDPNAPETPIFVDLYIDGPAGSGAPGYRVVANAPRQDVNDYFGLKGSNSHGYSFTLPAQFLTSNHTVYAYGISLFGQANPLLAQSPGTYSAPPTEPIQPPLCRTCSLQ